MRDGDGDEDGEFDLPADGLCAGSCRCIALVTCCRWHDLVTHWVAEDQSGPGSAEGASRGGGSPRPHWSDFSGSRVADQGDSLHSHRQGPSNALAS